MLKNIIKDKKIFNIIFLTIISTMTLISVIPVRSEYTDIKKWTLYDEWLFYDLSGNPIYLQTKCEIWFRHHYSEWVLGSSEASGSNQINKPPPEPWDYWVILKVVHCVWARWNTGDPWAWVQHEYMVTIFDAGTTNILWGTGAKTGYGWETHYVLGVGEIENPNSVDSQWQFNYVEGYSHKFGSKYYGGPPDYWIHFYGDQP
ncbi:MAG: hypothetical protein ACTSW1_08670 [Candidatus Hodarchaeales archaeon]